jgi:S-formylglutathione hydrolase FrmB
VSRIILLLAAYAASAFAQAGKPAAIIEDRSHPSEVLGEERHYRVFLPPDYQTSGKRYPVIYWFHGWSERFNRPPRSQPDRNYDAGDTFYKGDTISAFVAAHDVIVVKWDGYNPRKPGEDYLRPYNISPVETGRQFPLYFPELVDHIDRTYRTIADRDHRATAGLSMGGFMSFWVSGKYPDLVGSASNFMGSAEFYVGPRGFDVEYSHDVMYGNYEGLRTRLVTGSQDFIRFYHRRMNAIWQWTRPAHETENFVSEHGTPGMAKTLDFHMRAFAAPMPKPAVWNHADAYPNFTVWDWSVVSDRRRPAITMLEGVSKAGFRSAVREWLPDGGAVPEVKLTVTSARLYPPKSTQTVTAVRLRDGKVLSESRKIDDEGRLSLDLDGDVWDVGVGTAPALAVAGYRVDGANWATAGKPVKLRVRFVNKGAARSASAAIAWESTSDGVTIDPPASRLFSLSPGETGELVVTATVSDPLRPVMRLVAVEGTNRLPVDVPLFPEASVDKDHLIADGRPLPVWRHAVKVEETALGEGNGDGRAAPGEQVAILLRDGDAFRATELFTNDACVDNTARASDVWSDYDHVGGSAKYSLPVIRADCEPGHIVRALARVLMPDKPEHKVRYAVVEFPVWYRAK